MITLVCGPPCSGKSTYVARHARPGDLVLDRDVMAQELGSPRSHNHHAEFNTAAGERFRIAIAQLVRDPRRAWVISSQPSQAERDAFAETIGASETVLLLEPRDVLVARAQDRPSPRATTRVIDWWLAKYAEDQARA